MSEEIDLETSSGPSDSKRIKLTSTSNGDGEDIKNDDTPAAVEVPPEENETKKEIIGVGESEEKELPKEPSELQNGDSDKPTETEPQPESEPEAIAPPVNDNETKKVTLNDNKLFSEELQDKVEEMRKDWEGMEDKIDEVGGISLYKKPFRHGEIKDFVSNMEFARGFANLFTKMEFHEKASDLFQFNQSDDLSFIVDPHVFAINEYLLTKVLPFLKKVTGLPLNETISMFLSIYKQTDFLLCHDDELEARRIAFIWYLSEEWSEDYGGTLDLFSATESLHPDVVIKKIVPEFNKFVFFEVGATSFHQVSEVLKEGKSRLALSGWFYGEPLARPKIEFPIDPSFNVLESSLDENGILKKFIAEMYHNSDIYSEINEQLTEDSEVIVPGFLRDEVYASICESIVDSDLSGGDDSTTFRLHGPPNVSQYKEAISGPPAPGGESSTDFTINSLRGLFYSKEFLHFMEQITEFPFTSCTSNKVVSSLQKYSHGSYSLMKAGGAKQTGTKPDSDEEEVSEEDPNFVDVLFFFANNWKEERGGVTIYSTTEGEQQQLIMVPPNGNCLAVVVRSSTVSAYTNYVNCLAKDDVYFVYKMTFAFDGIMQ